VSRSKVLPASRRQVFRSRFISFCRQDAGSNMNAGTRPPARLRAIWLSAARSRSNFLL